MGPRDARGSAQLRAGRPAGVEPVGGRVEDLDVSLIARELRIGVAHLVPQRAEQVEADDRPEGVPDDDDPPIAPAGVQAPEQLEALAADRLARGDIRRPGREIADRVGEVGAQEPAEGVETPEQRAFLAELKCEEIQGFLVGRPSPVVSFDSPFARQRFRAAG